jgi:hypothetical protein
MNVSQISSLFVISSRQSRKSGPSRALRTCLLGGARRRRAFRPSIVLVTVALAAAAFGIVLHNADLAGLAVGLLISSPAPPAPAAE